MSPQQIDVQHPHGPAQGEWRQRTARLHVCVSVGGRSLSLMQVPPPCVQHPARTLNPNFRCIVQSGKDDHAAVRRGDNDTVIVGRCDGPGPRFEFACLLGASKNVGCEQCVIKLVRLSRQHGKRKHGTHKKVVKTLKLIPSLENFPFVEVISLRAHAGACVQNKNTTIIIINIL